jgi:hypothetical protein
MLLLFVVVVDVDVVAVVVVVVSGGDHDGMYFKSLPERPPCAFHKARHSAAIFAAVIKQTRASL